MDRGLSPQRKREKLLEALLNQLEAEARRRPVLAVFEDAHWIDPTSRELLDLMVDRVQRLPILLAITFRPEFQPPCSGRSHVTTVTLNRLEECNRNPWTTRNLLPFFIELNNRVLDRFSPEERKNIGVHVCPVGDVHSVHSADVPYEELLKQLFKLNAGYFQLQMASERDREAAYKLVGKHLREDANGLPQMAYIGVIVTQSPRPQFGAEVLRSVSCCRQTH